MMESAISGGTTDIVATPHANAAYEYRRAEAESLVRRLEEASGGRLRIYLGCDLHLGLEEVERALHDPPRFSLNGRGYVLVEPPEAMSAKTVSEVCQRMRSAGLRPVLTHPERYATWRGRDREIERWVAEGIRLQITGGSLLGQFGSAARKSAEKIIAKRWAHFLASDAHDARDRRPDLSAVYALVEDRWGAPTARQLLERNPEAAIFGGPIQPVSAPARSMWLTFGR
jgi:protein-tyrosine phosphatase